MGIKSALKNLITKAGGTVTGKSIGGLINDYASVQGGGGSGGGTPQLVHLGRTDVIAFTRTFDLKNIDYTFPDNKTLYDYIGDKTVIGLVANARHCTVDGQDVIDTTISNYDISCEVTFDSTWNTNFVSISNPDKEQREAITSFKVIANNVSADTSSQVRVDVYLVCV